MGEVKKPTSEEYILQFACAWGMSKKALIAASPEERQARQTDLRLAEKKLFNSVEIHMKKNFF